MAAQPKWDLSEQSDRDAMSDALASAIDRIGDMPARLRAVEQIVASQQPHQSAGRVGGFAAQQAVARLREDHAFAAVATAAARGQSLAPFALRTQMETSIRALIGGELTTDQGYVGAPPDRSGIAVPVQRPIRLLDVLRQRPTTSDAVEFIRLSKTGTAATQAVQGDEKAQLRIDGTPATAFVATVACWTPASKQILSDVAGLQDAVNRLLRDAVADEVERLVIAGPGGIGQIEGLLEVAATLTPSAPVVAEGRADRLGEGVAVMAAAGYRPDIIVAHPIDWLSVQRAKTNVEGAYLLGSPAVPLAPSLWGCSVVTSSSLQVGEALVLDTSRITLLDREQAAVSVSNSHSDYFVRNMLAVLAEVRCGLEVRDVGAVLRISFDGLDEPVSEGP